MGQDDGIEFSGQAAEEFIALTAFVFASLKQSAIEQDASFGGFQQVLASRDLACGPQKCQLHDLNFLNSGCTQNWSPCQALICEHAISFFVKMVFFLTFPRTSGVRRA
jgi:hypothetical protein